MTNNNLTKQEITILKTWDGETFEIEMKYEDFLQFELETKEKGQDGFNLGKYRRFIKFSTIKDKIGKTKHLALPEPKKQKMFCELGHTEKKELKNKDPELFKKLEYQDKQRREKNAETIRKSMKKTESGRKKRFIEQRQEILEKLKKSEKYFGLETTISKLEEYGKLKNNL